MVFGRFLIKEANEIRRTWRLWVVGGVLVFFAVLSPLSAKAIPYLAKYVSGPGSGITLNITRQVTYLDSYAQWIKNLSQLGTMLVIFASASLIAGERVSGTVALVVTKPVSRSAFVAAKYVAQALLIVVATVIATLVVLAGTLLAFGEAPPARLLPAVGAWLALALVAVAVAEALSAVLPAIAAAIVALVIWALAGIAGSWEPAVRFSPVGLLSAPSALLLGQHVGMAWPTLTAAAAIVAIVALAALLFSRVEL